MNKKSFWPLLLLLGFGLLLCHTPQARAQIVLESVILNFPPGVRPISNLQVNNTGNQAFYVTTKVEKVEEPGSARERTVPSEEILVSPKSFSIGPKSSRTVRLILRNPATDIEKVYRVAFVPQERSTDEEEKLQSSKKAVTQIRVLTGMGALVFAPPPDPRYDLSWTRESDRIVFTNTGNTQVSLLYGKACKKQSEECSKIPGSRIYAGQSWELKVPAAETVIYSKREGLGDESPLEIPPKS